MVEYTGICYIIPPSENISVMVEYTGIWYIIVPWLEKITQGRIYRNVVYSTMVRSNIPECDLLFDFGKKKLVKVQFTGIWYIIDLSRKKSVKVEYIGMRYIRP